MMRSMFSGVSSLRVHQTRMDVIANNIANVNTVGFKSARATFADSFYQNLQGASGPDPTTGRAGTNPLQIGLGLNLGSIDNIMTQGAAQRTDNAMDAMISGAGFFIVNSPDGQFFTRAGNINEDRAGNLHINGMQLMGWSTRINQETGEHYVDRSSLVELQLTGPKRNMPAEPTTVLDIIGNLRICQLDERNQVVRPMNIYDSLGHTYQVQVRFTFHPPPPGATPPPGTAAAYNYWTFEFIGSQQNGDRVVAYRNGIRDADNRAYLAIHAQPNGLPGAGGVVDAGNFQPYGTIAFNTRGEVVGIGTAERTSTTTGTPPVTTVGAVVPISFATGRTDVGPVPAAGGWIPTTHDNFGQMWVVPTHGVDPLATFGNTQGIGPDRGTAWYVNGAPAGTGATGTTARIQVGTMNMNLTELRNNGGMNMTLQALAADGNPPGTLGEISIGGDGTIMGRFTNGRLRVLGQIPLALFRNPAGLQRMGNNLWVPTANSGPFDGIGQIGTMQGGALEMSNVDLANEFTEMITTQRGFQAASRTITVSDEMLQELVNLRR